MPNSARPSTMCHHIQACPRRTRTCARPALLYTSVFPENHSECQCSAHPRRHCASPSSFRVASYTLCWGIQGRDQLRGADPGSAAPGAAAAADNQGLCRLRRSCASLAHHRGGAGSLHHVRAARPRGPPEHVLGVPPRRLRTAPTRRALDGEGSDSDRTEGRQDAVSWVTLDHANPVALVRMGRAHTQANTAK